MNSNSIKRRGPPGLTWFEVHFPHDLAAADVVRLLQPLAHRPLVGWFKRTPAFVLELRGSAEGVRYLIGLDEAASTLPTQMVAQLPGLVLVPLDRPSRPSPHVVSDVRLSGLTRPLRTDVNANVTAGLLATMNGLTKGQSVALQWVVGPAQSRSRKPERFSVTRALGLVAVAHETADDRRLWKEKVAEPLFLVRGRIGARARSEDEARSLVHRLGEALQLASGAHADIWTSRPTTRSTDRLDQAASGASWSGVLNLAELAGLIGWPVDGVDSLRTARGRQYPAPPALLVRQGRRDQPSVRVLGAGLHPSQRDQLVTLPTESALHHAHIVGPTGSGKSTLLEGLLHADIAAGRSVFVLEPRGDLVDGVLAGVPAERRKDVVVIEPGQSDEVIGFNPLAGSREDAERQADHLLHLFHELYGTSIGPRSSDVLLHALVALARADQGTLADLPVLLTNAAFRRQVLAKVNDPLVLAPFFGWFDSLSEAERQQVISPVLNKTRAFLSRTAIRRLLGQAAPRFSLDDLFQRPRIVLINLNTGIVGSETAQLLGTLLVMQLWQAMQRRALLPATHRHPVMVVIDEVQNYLRLPVDLGDMFAQARGLRVGLTVAHQHLAQLPPKMKAGLLANARSRVVFRPSPEDGAPLAQALGGGLVAQDLALLQAHEAYAEVLTGGVPSRPFLVRTLPPRAQAFSDPADLRRESAARFGVDGLDLDARLRQRWTASDRTPGGLIGQQPRRAT
ncbi:type IV secretory system conjugative DNA transfer family protein [Streptomyces antibioticus]|uniref:type IV secretory system conjugative DNA transfer family protein n=1 Tax=Streptomyces antibioticus TaxID=1890 RepID=UPI00225121ED|nr:type IV secretion system DNA-binding domain-containing protein [Streptomyces antibioticus]MCX4742794.1 type IV secretion system DNA-binding domain-containing protein [Streptomyces antibioticus]